MNPLVMTIPGFTDEVRVKITGFRTSQNTKTGDMIQIYIHPAKWSEDDWIDDNDSASCNGCPRGMAGDRSCYVLRKWGMTGLRHVVTGKNNTVINISDVDNYLHKFTKPVRFGAYGEPVLLGEEFVAKIAQAAPSWTGYTHKWRNPEYQWARKYFMASVDTEAEKDEAIRMGWRTFRVSDLSVPMIDEVSCPASKEAGYKTTCSRCKLCMGNSKQAKSVVIQRHSI